MSRQIAPDLVIDGLALSRFRSPDGAIVPFAPAHKPLPRLAERAVAQQVQRILAPHAHGRRKLWDFDGNLHCSIIGTCLTNAELRQIIVKLGLKEAAAASEHDLHGSGVMLAGKHHDGAKFLHKALDRRHRIAINQFARSKSPNEVRALRQDAVQRGEQMTVRAVARFADSNNIGGDPAMVRHKLAVLRRHCYAAQRDYDTIEKTQNRSWLLARDAAAVAAKRVRLSQRGPLRGLVGAVSEAIDKIRQCRGACVDLLINSDYRDDSENA
jgi:hypothetical protein